VKDILAEKYITEIASNMLDDDDLDAAKWIANYMFMATQASQSFASTHNPEDLKDFQAYNKKALELFNAQTKKGTNSVALSKAVRTQYDIYMSEV
jgi:hypothetical protein